MFNHCIDILPYRYVSQIPTLCYSVLVPCKHTHMHVYVCGYVCVYIRTSEFKSPRVCQDTPYKWYILLTFSFAIFDENLVRQTNQGLPKILPQYSLETALTMT